MLVLESVMVPGGKSLEEKRGRPTNSGNSLEVRKSEARGWDCTLLSLSEEHISSAQLPQRQGLCLLLSEPPERSTQ